VFYPGGHGRLPYRERTTSRRSGGSSTNRMNK
jgi:hypothetical protein